MKRCFCVVLTFALCLGLLSCSKQSYADGVPCKDICLEALGELGAQAQTEYAELGEAHREFYFGSDEHYDDCYIAYSTDTNDINELGVFHAADGERANALFEICRDYVSDLSENSRAFIESYAPGELSKLDSAQVWRFGNYVVYAVMSDTDTARVFATAKALLEN